MSEPLSMLYYAYFDRRKFKDEMLDLISLKSSNIWLFGDELFMLDFLRRYLI